MNKQALILAGTAIASLGAGAAGGYFYAAKKLGKAFDDRMDREIITLNNHYQKMREDLYEELSLEVDKVEEPAPEEVTTRREKFRASKVAQTDYRGISNGKILNTDDKPEPAGLIKNNIIADAEKDGRVVEKGKKALPPRDDSSGRFVKQTPEEPHPDAPYTIEMDDFLGNPFDYEQENLRYFDTEDGGTLLDTADETIDNDRVGQRNLDELKKLGYGHTICVRNEGLAIDYEILYTDENIAHVLGIVDPEELEDDGDEDMEDIDRVSSAIAETRAGDHPRHIN